MLSMSNINIKDEEERSFELVLDALKTRNDSAERLNKRCSKELEYFEVVEQSLTSQLKGIKRTKWAVILSLCVGFYFGINFLYRFIQGCF